MKAAPTLRVNWARWVSIFHSQNILSSQARFLSLWNHEKFEIIAPLVLITYYNHKSIQPSFSIFSFTTFRGFILLFYFYSEDNIFFAHYSEYSSLLRFFYNKLVTFYMNKLINHKWWDFNFFICFETLKWSKS